MKGIRPPPDPAALPLQMKITSAFGAFLDPVADKIMWAGLGWWWLFRAECTVRVCV